MADQYDYRPMEAGEEKDVYDLVVQVFHEHVAPVYSKEGIEKFLSALYPEWLREAARSTNSVVILAERENRLIGMAAAIHNSHIALIFVDSWYHCKGVGKHLIDEVTRLCVDRDPTLKAITVSSSPNSIGFYQAADFQPQGEEVDEDGMRFVPMQKIVQSIEQK